MFACVIVHGVADGNSQASADALSLLAREYSPRVEAARGAGVVFDASGLDRLFGGAHRLAVHVAGAAGARGWTCGVAVARTRTTALVLAQAGSGVSVVPPGDEARVLAPLPLALLALADQPGAPVPAPAKPSRPAAAGASRHYRMAPPPCPPSPPEALSLLDTLRRWGLLTVGDLAALPRAELHGRLGEAGVRWHRLAHGDDLRPLVREVAEEPCTQTLALDWPIEALEPLSFVLTRLLEPLCARLERTERGAVGLRLWLRLITREVSARYLQVPVPMRDTKALRTLLLLHLESYPPGAGIDEVTLTLDLAPGRVVQHSLWRRPLPAPDRISTLMARLAALMGEGRCGQPRVADTLRPGVFALDRFAPEPVPSRAPASAAPTPRTADDGQRHARQGEPAAVLRRYRRPLPARITLGDNGRPVRLAAGLATTPGGTRPVTTIVGGEVREAAGPWRTSGEWWRERPAPGRRGGPWDREEWDVAVAGGGIYRLSRDLTSNQWVVEGCWD